MREQKKKSRMIDDKKKPRRKWLSVVLKVVIALIIPTILIGIPWMIDRFLAHEVYMIWCSKWDVPSPMEVGEWFGFLGSYLGAVGTIIIGIVAYRQTHIINEQNKNYSHLQNQIAQMQKEINDFQMHPIIYIKNTSIEFVREVKKSLLVQQEMDEQYFSVYGKQCVGSGIQYIKLNISFDDKGIIPTVQCEIMDFEWKIADNNYQIELSKFKQKIDTYDTIYMLIDDSDTISDKDAFFQDLDAHKNYLSNGFCGYDKSILKLKICFINQKGYRQIYDLIYRVRCGANGLEPGFPFMKSEKEG